MTSAMRIGDMGQGICYFHNPPEAYTTVFVSGAGSVGANGEPCCFVGTVGTATCGHPTIALSGSPDVSSEGIGMHRSGDVGQNGGPYIALAGSPDVFANNG